MARVCVKRDTYPDGTEWIGKGIDPDIKVHPTVADLQAGRDTVLKVAQNTCINLRIPNKPPNVPK